MAQVKKVLITLLMMTVMLVVPQSALGADQNRTNQNWTLVWSDEFNGSNGSPVDGTKWAFDIGDGSDRGIPGWGNNELQYYTNRTDNCYQENGCLVIKAQKEEYGGKSYTSARVTTNGKAEWKYGRFEIKAKLPYGQGLWPAIWGLPSDDAYGRWPSSGEFDAMESPSHNPAQVYSAAHWGDPYQNSTASYFLKEGSFASDFHIFAVEWEPSGEMRWYVDGVEYHKLVKAAPFDRSFHLLMNVAIGGNWAGNPDPSGINTILPQAMLIDYVRVFQHSNGAANLQAVQKKLNDFIKEQQLYYIDRSYSEQECFTDSDLASFEYWQEYVQLEIIDDERMDSMATEIKTLSPADQERLFDQALQVYSPTWGEMGYIDPNGTGQTQAGQDAEKALTEMIVDLLRYW